MKVTALPIMACLLAGCGYSPQVNELSQEYVDARRSLHNDLSDLSLAWICRGMSVFEWRRLFDTPEKVEGWRALCANETDSVPDDDVSQ